MITAEHLNQLRATRSALIRIEADELLQNIADGMNPADLREAATVAEAQLRDSIAAPHLYVAPLRDVTRQARAQGMRIRLVDSSNGNTDLHTLIEAATNAIREAPHAATVTVRAEPAGRSTIGTILIHNGDKQEIFPITANQPGLNSREYYHRWNVERAQWDSHP